MPKIKTHKSTAKRFARTSTGKLLRMKQGQGHLRRRKPRRVRAAYHDTVSVGNYGLKRRVSRLAPYLSKQD